MGVQIGEAAQGPDGEDVSIGGVANSAAFVEHACDVLLEEGKSHVNPRD